MGEHSKAFTADSFWAPSCNWHHFTGKFYQVSGECSHSVQGSLDFVSQLPLADIIGGFIPVSMLFLISSRNSWSSCGSTNNTLVDVYILDPHAPNFCLDMNFQSNPPHYVTVPQTTGAENMLQHGYIGLTFGSHTESFFASVLKASPRYLQVGFSAPGWPTAFYIDPINNIAVPANAMSARGYLIMVLDYRADLSRGTIVPQIPWFPQTPRDVRKYVTDAVLQLPIFLRQDDGSIGMSLSDVVNGNFRRLVDSVRQVSVGGRTSVHIRINWPGYNEWKRQFQTRDETPNRNPITIEKFVRHIGRSVDKFMSGAVSELHQGDPRWRIGFNGITRNDVILVGVVHVSSGSWMPILQLNRRLVY